MQHKVLILDFGSQYSQVIARRVRELNIYCELFPFDKSGLAYETYNAIILSGGPASVRDEAAPSIDLTPFRGKIPVLGICYGAQLMAVMYNGTVSASKIREYGKASLEIEQQDLFFEGLDKQSQVWMSHSDTITELPSGASRLACTNNIGNAAFKFDGEHTYGVQFHPEVSHTEGGKQLLENFLVKIAGLEQNWTPDAFIENSIATLKEQLNDDQVVLGLSGGVDSSVAALLLQKAIGDQLHCIFIDNGLLRKDEYNQVLKQYQNLGLNIIGVDASNQFLNCLKGITDPEAKRKQIGKTFIDIFEEKAKTIPNVKWLAQGTIYPDVIESVSSGGPSVTIKSHHNVGGLPEKMNLSIVEPLRLLFKDEVREIGAALGMPPQILKRHPFPGPGLAIRIIGDITEQKVQILQEADAIFIDNLKQANLYDNVWQAGVILLPIQSVGVMGDERTYEQVVALRAVSSKDGMTADWINFPYEFLKQVSNDIINKVKGINRVVYDISSKPPATIEWE